MKEKSVPLFVMKRYFFAALALTFILFALTAPRIFAAWRESHQRLLGLQEKWAHYNALLREQAALQAENEKLRQILGPKEKVEEAMTSFIRVVEKLATERNLTLNQIRPKEREVGDEQNTIRIVLQIEAALADLVKFFYGIFELPGLIQIDRLELRANPEDSSKLRAELTLSKTLL